MIGTWYVEAGKYGVMPIDGSGLARMVAEKPLVAPAARQLHLPARTPSRSRSSPARGCSTGPHSITADVEIPEGGAEGVLLCQGTAAGGYSFFIKDGRLRYVHNYVGREPLRRRRPRTPVPAGHARAALRVRADRAARHAARTGAPGRLQLYVDGTLVGAAEAPVTTPFVLNPGALTCGANPGSPVTPDYASPFRFTGTIHRVTVDVSGELIDDDEAELRAHMARQ